MVRPIFVFHLLEIASLYFLLLLGEHHPVILVVVLVAVLIE